MNATAKLIGLDIAKNVFVAIGIDEKGKKVLSLKLKRDQVLATFANIPSMTFGIEACAGTHYWARQLKSAGHEVKLIAAQHTRAYVTGSKNDSNHRYAKQTLALLCSPCSTSVLSLPPPLQGTTSFARRR